MESELPIYTPDPSVQHLPEQTGLTTGEKPAGKIDRIGGHVRTLKDDLTEWTDLRMQLAVREIEEKVEEKVIDTLSTKIDQAEKELNGLLELVVVGVVAAVAGLFALVGVALLLGNLLGNAAFGFFALTGILLFVALLIFISDIDLATPMLNQIRRLLRLPNGSK